ncbi:MAG: DUF1501 domain-containing protein, partial [Planctomycetes bacterium]|nr:DUF1501 domain-containing protein [Planctomycetota bacterium]
MTSSNQRATTDLFHQRRQLLTVGALGMTGLSLPRLFAAEAARGGNLQPAADACILIFLNGGPSHHDMWDMKPQAAVGIRGPFKPIATSLPGYQIGEHLPRLARLVHRATIVRSMHHGVNNSHAAAVYCAMTGHDRGEKGGGARPDDNPTPGSVFSMLRPPKRAVAPNVHLPYITKEGAAGPPQPGFFGGYLGRSHDPLFVLRDPNAKNFRVAELTLLADVSVTRMAHRRLLFDSLKRQAATWSGQRAVDAMDGFQRRAFELLTSKETQRAFHLADEPAKTRDTYGRNRYGQSVLLARRLIEAGTRMVTVSWAPDANATWDTHGNNFNKLKNTLLPQFDAACASLIQDLADRRLLDRTVIAVLGDFGRTPKINKNAGRDHWNHCYSVMFVGGGFRSGLIHGSS